MSSTTNTTLGLRSVQSSMIAFGCRMSAVSAPTVVATWIAEVERERRRLERELRGKPAARKLTTAEIKALVRQLKDIVAVLTNADPADKRAIYDELGVNLTYHPDGRVQVGAGGRVLRVRVGGGT
jgi:hypothetical protein